MPQSQSEIDQFIQRAKSTNRDLVRRDVLQALQSSNANLILKLSEYYYSDGRSKELLCLSGTVACQYKGSRYNIPVEIWLQQDHPHVIPLAYVRPTSDMYVSTTSDDVQPDGTIVISYLKKWRHPNSDLVSLLNAMSEAFSRSPPVYSGTNATRSLQPNINPTPYPIAGGSMPMPSYSTSYPSVYPNNPLTNGIDRSGQRIPNDIYRDSLQSAVLDKIRLRLNDLVQINQAQIDSLKRNEQDLIQGENQINSLISNAQEQQKQIQIYLTNLRSKLAQMTDASQKMSSSSSSSLKDDALTLPAPIYKRLLECYAEEHSIQDLLFYLADGLRKESIGLDIYLKHVRELSRRQFILRATMYKCRQIAGLHTK